MENLVSGKPIQALLDDRSISFNIRRSDENRTPFPRKAMLLYSSPLRRTVVPGLVERQEAGLCSEIRPFQDWKTVTEYSPEIEAQS